MFLYVHENSDDFHLIFPSSEHRELCYERIMDMRDMGEESIYGSRNFVDIKPNVIHVREIQKLFKQ